MSKKQVDSVTAGIEPKVAIQQPAATPRLDPREAAEHSENAVFPETLSELNALMEVIKEELSKEPLIIAQLEPILVDSQFDPEQLIEEEATAVGAGANVGGEGSGFVRLLRVQEGVTPLAFSYETALTGVPNILPEAALLLLDPEGEEPVVVVPTPEPTTPPLPPPVVEPPVVEPPVVEPPVVEPPVVEPPVVEPPVVEPPVVEPPVIEPPVVEPPVVEPPVVEPPVVEPPVVEPPNKGGPQGNNGFGNGDQNAPGNSGPNNNAENAGNVSAAPEDYPGNSNNNGNKDVLNPADLLDDRPGNSQGRGPDFEARSLLFDIETNRNNWALE